MIAIDSLVPAVLRRDIVALPAGVKECVSMTAKPATTTPQRFSIEVERVAAPTDEVRALIAELESELAANYPPEQRHGLSVEAIFQPNVRFFVARVTVGGGGVSCSDSEGDSGRRDGGEPVGCGGIALLDGFAELKRMFARPAWRGAGVADAIITRLEHEALACGRPLVRLETGTEQHAAIRFYERRGYRRCAAFEPYASMSAGAVRGSVFMERFVQIVFDPLCERH